MTDIKINWKSEIILIIISILIITVSSIGYYVIQTNYKEDAIKKEELAIKGIIGFGIGLIIYILLCKLFNPINMLILSIIFISIGSIYINDYNNLSEDCKKTIKISDTISTVLIGLGVGIFFHFCLHFFMNKEDHNKKFFPIFTAMLLLIPIGISSFVINIADKGTEGNDITNQKNIVIGFLSVFIFIFIVCILYSIFSKNS